MSSADDSRLEEFRVLESIYPDYILETNAHNLRLEIPIELDSPHRVLLTNVGTTVSTSTASSEEVIVSYLPSILLDINLRDGYPLSAAPTIPSLHSTRSWLDQEPELLQYLSNLWEGEEILCTIVEFIRSGEFLSAMGLAEGACIRLSCPSVPATAKFLRDYDADATKKKFTQSSYACSICLTSVKGAQCIQLACDHVFCRPCLHDYWGLCIAEGSVDRVACADSGCVKEARMASEEEVRRVVSEQEVTRWRWLRTKKDIEKDPTIMHCPITTCQEPVRKPPLEPNVSSGWERFRSCESCGFNFCSFCKHTWHGAVTECPLSSTNAVVTAYLDFPEGSLERAEIEHRYGRLHVLRLVKAYEEEQLTRKWVDDSTTACPSCKINVEKSVGCNHMQCMKCQTHFCYRCGERLDAQHPYAHFSIPGNSRCYGKLFDYDPKENDGWQPMNLFEAL